MRLEGAVQVFTTARRWAKATGLIRPLRPLSPWAGRIIYRLSVGVEPWQMIHGHQMKLADGPNYPPLEMLTGNWERDTVRLFERTLRPGDVVLDLGAHVGYFTLIAARCVGAEGRVYAFEPEPSNYRLLQSNVVRNGYRHVITVPLAVSDRSGTAELRTSGLDNGQHSLYATGRPERRRQLVRTIRLAEFLATEGIARVDWIKMDLEGAEEAALRGLGTWLQECPALRMVLEFCPIVLRAAGTDPLALLDGLRGCGFRFFLYDAQGTYPLDDAGCRRLLAHLDQPGSYKNLLCIKGAWSG